MCEQFTAAQLHMGGGDPDHARGGWKANLHSYMTWLDDGGPHLELSSGGHRFASGSQTHPCCAGQAARLHVFGDSAPLCVVFPYCRAATSRIYDSFLAVPNGSYLALLFLVACRHIGLGPEQLPPSFAQRSHSLSLWYCLRQLFS